MAVVHACTSTYLQNIEAFGQHGQSLNGKIQSFVAYMYL